MTARKNAAWTDAEIEILRDLRLKRMPVPAIALQLARPVSAVYAQARKIGTRVMDRTVWSDPEDARLREMVAEGMPDKEICDRLGRSPASVRWRMKVLGLLTERRCRPAGIKVPKAPVLPRKPRRKPNAAPREDAVREGHVARLKEMAATHTRAQAAAALGLKPWQVDYALRDTDVTFLDPRSAATEAARADIRRLHDEGVPEIEIAHRIGRPRAWVRRAMAQMGLLSLCKRGKGADIDVEGLRRMAASHTITEAARALTRDARTLRKMAMMHGIEFRKAERVEKVNRAAARKDNPWKAPGQIRILSDKPGIRSSGTASGKAVAGVSAPLPPEAMARRLMMIRDIAERMRAEGRLPPQGRRSA